MERKRSNVVLTKKEWNAFRPLLKTHNIIHEPSGYGNGLVYVSMSVTDEEYALVDVLLQTLDKQVCNGCKYFTQCGDLERIEKCNGYEKGA